jgi:hypothetical protein
MPTSENSGKPPQYNPQIVNKSVATRQDRKKKTKIGRCVRFLRSNINVKTTTKRAKGKLINTFFPSRKIAKYVNP